MHIPDALISPTTAAAAGTVMVPVWAIASARVKRSLSTRQVPLLAIGAAFSFTIMLFNLPVVGGTTVHPVGTVLLAVLLGPWAAIIGVSVALAVQALFFGDGGVVALGANSLSMACVNALTGYIVYRLITLRRPSNWSYRPAAAGIAAYVGLNAAALVTATILGLQPYLFHDAAGRPLYFALGLRITVPALMLAHLFVAGPAEALVTAAAVRFAMRTGIGESGSDSLRVLRSGARFDGALASLALLVILSPLGLLARGSAWGEWNPSELAQRVGYTPVGTLHTYHNAWRGFALFPNYMSDRGPVAYGLAGLCGALLLGSTVWLIARVLVGCTEPVAVELESVPANQATPALPDWLLRGAADGVRCMGTGGSQKAIIPQMSGGRRPRRQTAYLERTLAGIAESALGSLQHSESAATAGILQRLDPRLKILGLVCTIIAVTMLHRVAYVSLALAMTFALCVASGIPARRLLARTLPIVTVLGAGVAIPSAFNLVTPGVAALVIRHSPFIAITWPGVHAADLMLLRITTTIAVASLLSMSTSRRALIAGLQGLMVPRIVVQIMTMTWRYLTVLTSTLSDLLTARNSRNVGRVSAGTDRGFLGAAMGTLFAKTLTLTEEVHLAMLSRGWTGQLRAAELRALKHTDWAWAICASLFIILITVGDRLA